MKTLNITRFVDTFMIEFMIGIVLYMDTSLQMSTC